MSELINKEDSTYFGMTKEDLFYKIDIGLIRDKEDRERCFPSDSDGQFDYMLYITLLMVANTEREFYTTINILAKKMGYKPKSGVGKINDKITKSLERLMKKYCLIEYGEEDKIIFGRIILHKNEESFFKLKRVDINIILDNPFLKLTQNDYSGKYKDKAKALYVYSYILSMMGTHNTTEATIEWHGCFPSVDTIAKECNVSINYLLKILAYFEYDSLIYTTNIGKVKNADGTVCMAGNYYTNDKTYLSSSYIYARAYYDNNNCTYSKYIKHTKHLLDEISELLDESFEKLNDKEVVCFKEHYGLMFTDTIYKFTNLYPGINKLRFDEYMKNSSYLRSTFFNGKQRTSLSFIADNELASIPLLTHIKNKIKAMMYLYEIKTT